MSDFTKWTIEPHGNGFALYAGRDNEHHGLKVLEIIDPDPKYWAAVKVRIEAANDLYSALEELHQFQAVDISVPRFFKQYESVMAKADAALKKARGE